ncbi:MAG: gfo/Idh/MocA family oxidoreductase, partial [Bacteroidales bacterium]|nr:gfo/Idh/MocA family oxidoreductase [Bacteroidales bacterium]
TGEGLDNHVQNHLDCIKKRNRKTNASPEIAAHIAKLSAVGNIAYRTGKQLIWDGTKFTNDEEANNYLVPVYREPWKLPRV